MAFIAAAVGTAGVSGIAGLAGAFIGSSATRDAAKMQADAARHAADLQYQEFQTQQQNQAPWLAAGRDALPELSQMASQKPSFTQSDFLANQDPAYQFDMQQGLSALQASAAARGGLMSGNTLKGITDYSQGAASNEYQNAYSRFMNNQNTQFNRLSSVAGLGQTATGQLGQAGQNYANQAGEAMMGGANAGAGAQIAGGQLWGNTLSSLGSGIGNNVMQYQMMNRLMPQSGMGGGGFGLSGDQLSSLGTPNYESSAFGTIGE